MPPRVKSTTQLNSNPPSKAKINIQTASESQSTSNQTHSPPQPIPATQKPQSNRMAVERFAQSVHLIEGFADTLDAIPPSLTRSLSDLKELDAVLSAPLNQVHSILDQLLESFQNPNSIRPDQRLQLLRNIVSDMEKYNLGGQDKIRVANGTCESLSHHIKQLDTTTSLLISSLPPSLEQRIPASSFPSGYPKLTGSLRSKPVGGVWSNSNYPPLDHQVNSPSSIPDTESMSLNHRQSPVRDPVLNARTNDTQPVSKRARIGPSSSTSLAASSHLNAISKDESQHMTRSQQQAGASGKLLDQHMIFSQSNKKHRLPQESIGREESIPGEHTNSGECSIRGLNGKPHSTSLSRQNSQLGLIASPPRSNHLMSSATKNKRAPIPPALADKSVDHDDHLVLSHPALKAHCPPNQSQPTSQQTVVGPKKRARKSNPAGSIGRSSESIDRPSVDSTNLAKKPIDQANNPIASQEIGPSRTIGDHAKTLNSSSVGASSIKKSPAAGVRGANNNKNASVTTDQPALPPPMTTKRTYTKRNGMNNGGISLSKSKRAARRKAIAVPHPPPSADLTNPNSEANQELQVSSNNKMENITEQQKSRLKPSPILKESVRLQDVLEGVRSKARHPMSTSAAHSYPGAIQPERSNAKKGNESGRMGNEEDEDETEPEHDYGVQERLKTQLKHRNLGTAIVINQQQQSSSTKDKLSMNHHLQQRQTPQEHSNILSNDDNLILNDNQFIVHRDPNINVPVEMLSPKESVHSNDSARTYCFCNGEVYGDRMVACDNAECPIEWFHYRCAGLTEDPTGNWFCPDCQSKGFGLTAGKNRIQPMSSASSNQNNQVEEMVGVEAGESGKEGSMMVEGSVEVGSEEIRNTPLDNGMRPLTN